MLPTIPVSSDFGVPEAFVLRENRAIAKQYSTNAITVGQFSIQDTKLYNSLDGARKHASTIMKSSRATTFGAAACVRVSVRARTVSVSAKKYSKRIYTLLSMYTASLIC